MKNTTIELGKSAEKQLRKLPLTTVNKFRKQLAFLLTNLAHPSLRIKKKQGENAFEARIDYHYRFTFSINEDIIRVFSIGPHDEGLGKK